MERRFQYLDAHTHTGLVYSDAWLVSARSEKQALFSEHYPVSHPTGEVFADLIQHNFLLMSTVMVRQTCVAGIKFDESLDHCEDFDFWLKLAVNCRFGYVRAPLAYCRIPEEAFDPKNWGFAGGSYLAYRQIAGLSELQVQQRAIEMPIFQQLSRRQRAKIFCSHGIKNAMLTRLSEARHCFWKAILTAPLYPVSYVLLLASLLGLRVLQALIPFRRHLVGHRSWKRSSTKFPRRKA
jgi:hypothetical protein